MIFRRALEQEFFRAFARGAALPFAQKGPVEENVRCVQERYTCGLGEVASGEIQR